MTIETIPFKTFMAAPALGYAAPHFTTMLDDGLTFFCGLGVCLLGLAFLEKCGVKINETRLAWFMRAGVLVSFGFFLLKNALWKLF
ncbi:MAG: hypothetical protein LKH78_03325 [Weizmannia coagulans]|jgi:4-amino-4-deoxy-L-arabinose transferase-like glycosyltransferase|nr:hypothetical protein [Heyndrickxia coagulans]